MTTKMTARSVKFSVFEVYAFQILIFTVLTMTINDNRQLFCNQGCYKN